MVFKIPGYFHTFPFIKISLPLLSRLNVIFFKQCIFIYYVHGLPIPTCCRMLRACYSAVTYLNRILEQMLAFRFKESRHIIIYLLKVSSATDSPIEHLFAS